MNPASNPFLSVVIPTFERPDDLKKCLESLSYENQMGAPPFEIIVSDDSKSDDCKNLVENYFSHVKWGKGKQNGPAGNRNAGVSRAKGRWIIFLDDDCIAEKKYLCEYANEISNDPDVKVLEGRIFPDRSKRTWAEGCPANENGGLFWTSNLCINKATFEELGGLDERFAVAFEDVDLAHRFKQAKIKCKFVYKAAVCHPWRTLIKEGKNWKPIGYEWHELKLFLEKHPNATEHNSPIIYLRHLLRMVTRDFMTCIIKFKCAGIGIWFNQLLTTIYVIFQLIKPILYLKKFLVRNTPMVYSFFASLRRYPNYEKILYLKEISKNDMVIDLGANIGFYSELFGELVRDRGKVLCFEPVPLNFNLLQTNVAHLSWVECYHLAVGKKNEIKNIIFSESNLQKSTLLENNNLENTQSLKIEVVKVDDFITKHGLKRVDFIKCDVEGYELEALQGMNALLKRFKPKLSIEITLEMDKRNELFKYLQSCGYSHFKKIEKSFPTIYPKFKVPSDSYFYLYAS